MHFDRAAIGRLKIALVDDHEIFREALRVLLPKADPTIEVVAEAATGRDAVRIAQTTQPDVVVMDILLPDLSGLAAIREMHRLGSKSRILVLSALSTVPSIADALAAGADGYAFKVQPVTEIVKAMRAISQGLSYLPPTSGNVVAELRARKVTNFERLIDSLSIREREIFDLVIAGHTNQKVAELCFISAKTVETHRTRINKKLHTHSTGDLMRFAAYHGLIYP
jgi:two-component system, NarL family, response regulator NreC